MDIDTSNGFIVWSGKDRWIFGAFRGNFNIAYRPEGHTGRPLFGQGFTRPKFTTIREELKKIIAAPPETKRPVIFSKYDPEAKKYNTEFVITFIKDDSMMYHMDISYKDNGSERNDRCSFMSPGGVATGSDPMSKSDRSAIMIQSLLDWMNDELPTMFALSREKWTPPGKEKEKTGAGGNSNSTYFG